MNKGSIGDDSPVISVRGKFEIQAERLLRNPRNKPIPCIYYISFHTPSKPPTPLPLPSPLCLTYILTMSEQPLTDFTLPEAMVAPEEEEEDRVNIDKHQDEDTEDSSGDDDDDDDYEEEGDEDGEVVSSSSIRHLFFAESLIHTGRCW